MLAGRALYSLIIPLANTSPPRTVSEGCGLWERNRIKEGMTLPGYWRLPLFPRCPSAGCNNPVALLLSPPRDSAQMHWVDPRADLVVTEKQKKKGKTGAIAVLLHKHVASHVAGETGCIIGLEQKTRPYQRKRETLQAMASFTVRECVCCWESRPDLSSSLNSS